MKNIKVTEKTGKDVVPKAETQKGIENHKKAAIHFEAAAKSHSDAAKHHENGNHEKAIKSTIEAHGHASLAKEAQRQGVKHLVVKV